MYKYIEEGYFFKPKDRIRIAITNQNNNYGLIWIELGNDGSIYTNLIEEVHRFFLSKKEIISGENTKVCYDEVEKLEPIEDKEFLKGNKHSFHPSGVKHILKQSDTLETKTFWKNINNLDKKENVCSYIFKEINTYKILETERKKDIYIEYPIEENFPIACNISIQPYSEKNNIIKTKLNVKFQYNIYLVYEEVEKFMPIVIEIVFYHKNKAPYPDYTYSCWIAEKYDSSKKN